MISVPAQNLKAKQSQRFTFEIALMDLNNQEVSGSTSVVVHLADFYIGVMPADYVGLAGKAMDVNLITVDPDSHPHQRAIDGHIGPRRSGSRTGAR